jgi:hypothetical protein
MRHNRKGLRRPARFPAKWNHFADKDSRQVYNWSVIGQKTGSHFS